MSKILEVSPLGGAATYAAADKDKKALQQEFRSEILRDRLLRILERRDGPQSPSGSPGSLVSGPAALAQQKPEEKNALADRLVRIPDFAREAVEAADALAVEIKEAREASDATIGPGLDPPSTYDGIYAEWILTESGEHKRRLSLPEYGLRAEVPVRNMRDISRDEIEAAIRRTEEDNLVFDPEGPNLYDERHALNRGDKGSYYGSPYHRLWAAAAEAHVGGRITAEDWMRLDPFGGLAGGGARTVGDGFKGPLREIAFWHDTEWILARHFNVGQFADELYYEDHPAEQGLGKVGLDPASIYENLQEYRLETIDR